MPALQAWASLALALPAQTRSVRMPHPMAPLALAVSSRSLQARALRAPAPLLQAPPTLASPVLLALALALEAVTLQAVAFSVAAVQVLALRPQRWASEAPSLRPLPLQLLLLRLLDLQQLAPRPLASLARPEPDAPYIYKGEHSVRARRWAWEHSLQATRPQICPQSEEAAWAWEAAAPGLTAA